MTKIPVAKQDEAVITELIVDKRIQSEKPEAQIADKQMDSISPDLNKLNERLSIGKDVIPDSPVKTEANSVRVVTGSLDRCADSTIEGWVACKESLGENLEVEICADGQPIARLIARKLRPDLKKAGFGDGSHGFMLTVPEALFDGKSHVIEARETTTGFVLPGSPKSFQATPVERGSIRLEGGALSGWAKLAKDTIASLNLEIIEEGQVIASGVSKPDNIESGVVRFHLFLPVSVMDGRPHLFLVRSKNPSAILGVLAVITPYMLMPESALLKYAREGMKAGLAVAAGFRYESLDKSIAALLQDYAGAEPQMVARIAQLNRAHAILTRGFNMDDKVFEPLVFPTLHSPKVSIVIPVHNKFPVTYHCLASLLVGANKASFEVILVDDGSSDETLAAPDLILGIQIVRNEESLGFVRSCNRGGQLARGEYIVMLNNDTEVTSGWLDELLWTFEHYDKVGLAGAKLLNADGTLQEAGGIVWNTGNPWNYGKQANPRDPRYNYARQVDYLSGACLMLPLTLWHEIGGFSETYAPAYFEDTDLAFQVRDRGFKTVYTPFAQVIHFEGISNGVSTVSGTKRFQEINRPKFKGRWGRACRNNGKEGVELELNKDRNVQLRALVLDAETPMPDKNAGSYAAIQEMRMLQALGFKCTFAPGNLAWMGTYTETLQRMGVECVYTPFALSINELIQKRGSEFDLVYITRYYVAQNYLEHIRQYAPHAKILLMNADLHFLRELRAALHAKSKEAIAGALETREAELSVMRRVDLVLAYTDVEKAVILSHNLTTSNIAKCPWVAEVLNEVPGYETRIDIAFLGGFNHQPNAEAVEWFTAEVMPLLLVVLPDVKFRVYGSNVPKRLLTLAEKNENLIIEGWVPAVEAVYNSCRIFVAPLQSGAGIKGKVIGALAHGVPCVLSPIAAEGIAIGDGVDARVADKPQAWVEAIASLYNDPLRWANMSRQALAFAKRQYGFAKGVSEMQEALQQAEIFTSIENNALAAH